MLYDAITYVAYTLFLLIPLFEIQIILIKYIAKTKQGLQFHLASGDV